MLVSVVVPTYRRDVLLARCLKALRGQRFDEHQFEIFVADDGPSMGTLQLVSSLQDENGPPVRYLPVTATQGPAGARNAGWHAAVGKIIAFTDDDCVPDADWLSEGVRAMEAERADAVSGQTIVPLPVEPTDFERDAAGLATAEFVTANCFCRRDALVAVGGFDERFTAAWREDSDLHFTLLERGMKVVRSDRAFVVHPVRPMPWGVSLRQQRKGIFDPLLYRKHRQLYCQRVAHFPRTYYAALASLALAAFGVAGQWPTILAAGLAGWLTVTGLFAMKRLEGTSRRPSHVAEMVFTSALIPLLSVYWRFRGLWRYRVLHF